MHTPTIYQVTDDVGNIMMFSTTNTEDVEEDIRDAFAKFDDDMEIFNHLIDCGIERIFPNEIILS